MSIAEVDPTRPYREEKFFKELSDFAHGRSHFMPSGLDPKPKTLPGHILNDGIGYRVAEAEVMVDPQIVPEMFLGSFMQNMQGPMMAGSPSPYYSGIEKTANDALFRYGMDQTPRGATLRKNIDKLRQLYNLYGKPRGI